MKKSIFFCILLFCFLSSGCAFHLRSRANFPPQLMRVYFSSERPYSVLTTQLTTLFQSMDIQLVKSPSQAALSILISDDVFTYSRPDIVDTTLPTSINFSQIATVRIEDNKDKAILATQAFGTSKSLMLNPNQIYTANANDLIKQELNRRLVSLIYYWITSTNTKDVLKYASVPKAA